MEANSLETMYNVEQFDHTVLHIISLSTDAG